MNSGWVKCLAPEDVDRAIRAWGQKAEDPYDKGLAELYARNFAAASERMGGEPCWRSGLRGSRAALPPRSPERREKTLGTEHPDVAISLNNLSALLYEKGDYVGAGPLLRALAIDEKALGPDHPDLAIHLNNLAVLLDEKGDYARAESLLRRALAIDEKALGLDHPNTRLHRSYLDAVLKKKGPQ